MDKLEFISMLSEKLAVLPKTEIEKSVAYFSEIIEDRVEDGMSEAEAVASLESIDAIIKKIMYETPLPVLMISRMRPKGPLTTLNIVLIIAGSPIWLSLLIAGIAVILSVYASIWAVIVSLNAALLAFVLSGIAAIIFSPQYFVSGAQTGLFILGTGLFCAGLGVFLFFPVKALSKLLIHFTSRILKKVKALFIVKEVA